MAYLDENGLEHFWGKIKDHVSSAVAPKANDADVVHKTGDETVEGVKTFQNTASGHTAGNTVTDLVIRNPEVVRGTAGSGRSYTRVILADAEGDIEETFAGRLGLLEVHSPQENDIVGEQLNLRCYKYSGESADYNKTASIVVGYDTNEIPYAAAPITSDDRTDSTDIVTRGYMEASEWNWQKTKKAGAVTFKSVPESDLELVVDFMFTETLPAEGEKGPENPSTITGVTQAKVTRCGKNLLPFPYANTSGTENGIRWTVNSDKSITANGTATADEYFYLVFSSNNTLLKEGLTYTISGCPSGGSSSTYCIRFGAASYTETGNGYTFVANSDIISNAITLKISSGTTVSNIVFRPQLELGTAATAFEPYEGNAYTIQLGDTYYGGSLDVATGVMTVTKEFVTLNTINVSDGIVSGNAIFRAWPEQLGILKPINNGAEVCEELPRAVTGTGVNRFFVGAPVNGKCPIYVILNSSLLDLSGAVDPSNPTALEVRAAGNAYLNEHPLHMVLSLETPYTVQLTPTQIRSLPALDKYEPRINTVYTDQEAVQVGYPRYANYVDLTTDQTIDGEKVFRRYIRVKDKSFSVGYAMFPYDTYSSRADSLDSLGVFDNSDKRLFLVRTIDKDSNGNRYTNIYTMPASGNMYGSVALAIGLLDVDGASIGYAQAPPTPEYEADGVTKRTAGADIVTRDWIPKDTRIVQTSGSNVITAYNFAWRDNDTSGISISGGSAAGKGARLVLCGKSHGNNPGQFILHANNDNGSDIKLVGNPSGTLSWNGQTIQTTSDERLKTTLSEVPDAVLDAWEEVNWGQFQYLDAVASKGESARLHLGLIAQHVMSVFEKHGLDACAYGILCHEEREATEEDPAVDLWMVRYAEAQAMEAACMRRENARLKKRIADLEERLAALELKIS